MPAPTRVFIAGSRTPVGAALVRRLEASGDTALVGAGADEPDPTDPAAVDRLFASARPERVFVTAGAHAGIAGNLRAPADLMTENLLVAAATIPAAWRHGVERLVYLSSSCIYPKAAAPRPYQVDALWTGPLEPTSAAYAQAKLTALKLIEAYRQQYGARFIGLIPGDVYGPGDDFGPDTSHVVASLIRRVHEARVAGAPAVDVWGTGTPRREFLFVDDLASACLFVMDRTDRSPLNVGTGVTTSIGELASLICEVVGYTGELRFDTSRPDGMPFKGLDSTPLHDMGWRPGCGLEAGLRRTYEWFLGHVAA